MLHIYKDPEEVCDSLAKWISDLIKKTLNEKDKFTWALSGGETPKLLYQKLASDYADKINWQKIHIFWGDERYVPFDDPANNARMAYDQLLDKVNIPLGQIYQIRTDLPPEGSAMKYERILHNYFDGKQTTFDLILLGLGDDGHTLSLFPGSEIPVGEQRWVLAIDTKEKGERITLIPSVVNRSSEIIFLITGENKAKVLHEILEGSDKHKYPAQLIQPVTKELHWFLDVAAAKIL